MTVKASGSGSAMRWPPWIAPERAVPGLLGPIYFDSHQTTPRAAVFGVAQGGKFESAFDQLRPYSPVGGAGPRGGHGQRRGHSGQWPDFRTAAGGLCRRRLNEIGELDTDKSELLCRFLPLVHLYGRRYRNGYCLRERGRSDVCGSASQNGRMSHDGISYRLYHVTGRFKVPLQFHDFPFDQQHLTMSFRNRLVPSSELVYALDPQSVTNPKRSACKAGRTPPSRSTPFRTGRRRDVQLYQGSIGSTAVLGDPDADPSAGGLEYSLFTVDVTVERNLTAFR